jgi:zinc/manganese transport system substrate-binding protein
MPCSTRITVLLLILCLAGGVTGAQAEKKVRVIASFSILADLAQNVGGDRAEVTSLVGPNGDAHVYEPTPADASALSQADLVVINGLGLEGWLDRLVQTSGYKGPVVVVSKGIKPREMAAEEDQAGIRPHHKHKIDPHAWQDLSNGLIYVEDITQALSAVDPAGAPIYKANGEAYQARLRELDKWVKAEFASIPLQRRRMITSHDAFGYLGAAYGINILSPMGVSTESEPSAGGMAQLIRQIRLEKVTAVFIENVSDPRLMQQIGQESGVTLGGELYSDALSKPDGPAPTYIKMFKNNVSKIVAAMRRGL